MKIIKNVELFTFNRLGLVFGVNLNVGHHHSNQVCLFEELPKLVGIR